jgi:hypothetical protein
MELVTLRLFENDALKLRYRVIKGKRKLCFDQLHDLQLSQNISWVIVMKNEMCMSCDMYGFGGETCRKALIWKI